MEGDDSYVVEAAAVVMQSCLQEVYPEQVYLTERAQNVGYKFHKLIY